MNEMIEIKSSKRDVTFCVDFAEDYAHPERLFFQGSNPRIFNRIVDILNKEKPHLKGLFVSSFLWNNKMYHEAIDAIAESGVYTCVLTIPLDGYKGNFSNRPLYDFSEGEDGKGIFNSAGTKKEAAKNVYDSPKSYDLRIAPSISVMLPFLLAGISKNEDPSQFYSMHAKFFVGFRDDGTAFILIPSSNMDVFSEIQTNTFFEARDLNGEEVYRVKDMVNKLIKDFSERYDPTKDYKKWGDFADELEQRSVDPQPIGTINCTSPILCSSGNLFFNKLMDISNKAEKFLVLSAQHLTHYFVTYGNGTGDVVKRRGENGVPVLLFSQTYLKNDGQFSNSNYFNEGMVKKAIDGKSRALKLEKNLIQLIDILKTGGETVFNKVSYCFNRNWHGRFLLTETTLAVFTHNLTMGNLANTKTYFYEDENKKLQGTPERTDGTIKSSLFGEVGFFFILEDPEFCKKVAKILVPRLLSDSKTLCMYGSTDEIEKAVDQFGQTEELVDSQEEICYDVVQIEDN